jgi:hypothetical protein
MVMAKRISSKKISTLVPDRSIAEVKAIVAANGNDPTKGTFDGLTTSEIATYNHQAMFRGGEVRPDDQEWSMFTS